MSTKGDPPLRSVPRPSHTPPVRSPPPPAAEKPRWVPIDWGSRAPDLARGVCYEIEKATPKLHHDRGLRSTYLTFVGWGLVGLAALVIMGVLGAIH